MHEDVGENHGRFLDKPLVRFETGARRLPRFPDPGHGDRRPLQSIEHNRRRGSDQRTAVLPDRRGVAHGPHPNTSPALPAASWVSYSLAEQTCGQTPIPRASPPSTEKTDERRRLGDARPRRSVESRSPRRRLRRAHRRRGSLRGSAQPAIWFVSGRRRFSPSSKRETRSGAPGTCSAIRASARIPTCRHSATPFARGTTRGRSPTVRQFCAISPKPRGSTASIARIRFGHKVVGASWRSEDARWTLDVRAEGGETLRFSCNFLFMCTGYYEYAEGYMPGWPGMERFAGRIVHPQKWPEDLRYDGKRVVVIGSGATAVTLVPAMAETAAHVVMLQRSPTYIVARPSEEAMAKRLGRWLPARLTHAIVRWKNIALATLPFPPVAAQTGGGEGGNPQARAGRDRTGDRRRQALQPSLRAVGPAPVPRPGRRPVRGAARRQGVGRHRRDRNLHRDRPASDFGRGARSRHHRHRDRAQAAADGRDHRSRSTASRSKWGARRSTRA